MEETMKNLKKNYLAIAILLTGLAPWHIEAMNQPAAQQAAPADMKVKTSNGAVVTIPARQVQDFKTLADMQIDAKDDIDVAQVLKFSQPVMQSMIENLQSIMDQMQEHDEDQAISLVATSLNQNVNNMDPIMILNKLEAATFLQNESLRQLYLAILPPAALSDASMQLLRDDNAAYTTLIPKFYALIQEQLNMIELPENEPLKIMRMLHVENKFKNALLQEHLNIKKLPESELKNMRMFYVEADLKNDDLENKCLEKLPSTVLSDESMQLLCDNNPEYCNFIQQLEQNTKAQIYEKIPKQTWAELRPLTGHTNNVNSAAFSRDGTMIVTASWDKTAKIWDG